MVDLAKWRFGYCAPLDPAKRVDGCALTEGVNMPGLKRFKKKVLVEAAVKFLEAKFDELVRPEIYIPVEEFEKVAAGFDEVRQGKRDLAPAREIQVFINGKRRLATVGMLRPEEYPAYSETAERG